MVGLIGLGSFWNVFEVALGSLLGVLLKAQWSLSTMDLSMVIGAAFVGETLGSVILAPLADRFGRRILFQFNLLAYAVFSLATAFAPNLTVFLVLRMLTGVGLGAELTLVDTYLSELLPRHRRGRYIAWSYTLALSAAPIAAVLAKLASGTLLGISGWRWLLIIAALGATSVWLLRRRLPESPRWLAATGNLAEADRVLADIEHQIGASGNRVASLPDTPRAETPVGVSPAPNRYRRRKAMLWTMQILGPVGFWGFASIAPIVLGSKGIDLAHTLFYTVLIAVGYPLGSLISVSLTERVQRRTLVVVSTLAVAVFGVLFGQGTTNTVVIVAGFASAMAGIMQSNFTHIYQAELFHTANRSTAIGLPYAASRLISATLPFISLTVLTALGAGPLYTGCAMLLTGMAIVVQVLGPRTNSRALDTI
jgi:putative MFS transporter